MHELLELLCYLLKCDGYINLVAVAIATLALCLRPHSHLTHIHVPILHTWVYVFHLEPYTPCAAMWGIVKWLESIVT